MNNDQSTVSDIAELRNWPVFLVGCHRSGTTLLRFLLDSHDNLACPPESKFISGIETLVDYPQALEGLRSLGFPRRAVYSELRKFIDSFLREYAKRHGKRRWVDKTPNYYRLLPFLDEIFDGRVLFLAIARHPLDCIDSLYATLRATTNHPDPDIARAVQQHGKGRLTWARYWDDVNEHILFFSKAHSNRCWTVRYEDLVRRTNPTLRGICNFLGEPFSEDLVGKAFTQTHTEGLEGLEDPKIRSTRGITANRIGVWRSWPQGEVEALWKVVQSNAQEFGYSLSSDEGTALPKSETPVDVAGPEPPAGSFSSADIAEAQRDRLRQIIERHLLGQEEIIVAGLNGSEVGRIGSHPYTTFPKAGAHPIGSASAIVQFEALRAKGFKYFVLLDAEPELLKRYPGLKEHLERQYTTIVQESDGVVFALDASTAGCSGIVAQLESLMLEHDDSSLDQPISILDWDCSLELSSAFPHHAIFSPLTSDAKLPYLDASIDIVITRSVDRNRLNEARRVARLAVVIVGTDGASIEVERRSALTQSNLPAISIVLATQTRQEQLEASLRALSATLPRTFRGEIIVVNEENSDEIGTILAGGVSIKLIKNESNAGFAQSLNLGARAAAGEFLVFLHNDAWPLPGWLLPLLQTFRQMPSTGAVGGKLVQEDGALKQAGGVVLRDGTAVGYGAGDTDIDTARYQHVREVDYCSAAMLATRTSLFRQLGGFDERYQTGLYAEMDYCFRMREQGYKMLYQPESVIIDRERGMECDRELDQKSFAIRWARALEEQPQEAKVATIVAPQPGAVTKSKQRKRVLVGSYVPPESDRSSGARRILHLIEFLIEDGWSVTFLAHRPLREQRYVRTLQQRGIAVYDSRTSTYDLFAARGFDLAIFAFWPVAEAFIPIMRAVSPGTRIIVDSIDVHFLRSARGTFTRGESRNSPLLGSGFGSDIIRELNVYASADAVLTVSPKEASLINDFTADPHLAYVVADCEDLERVPVPLNKRSGIVFVGYFPHKPNARAVEYLCLEILPKVDTSLLVRNPVHVIGDGLGDELRAFARGLPHVQMVGWVPSIEPYLQNARISVVPLLYGAGTKRKVIQSLLAGTPLVSTSIGVEGLNVHHDEHVLVADQAESFAASIARLLSDDLLWSRLARDGTNQLRNTHGRETVRAHFQHVLADISERDPKPAILLEPERAKECITVHQYRILIGQIRQAVHENIPKNSTVLVFSKGDDDLLQLNGCRGWHFPQNSEGVYAGYYPSDGAEVIRDLEGLRSKGAEYLVLPQPSFWWLDNYEGLRKHLETEHQQLLANEDCIIYRLAAASEAKV